MEGQIEGGPVDGQHAAGLDVDIGLDGVFGIHVTIHPGCTGAIGTDLDDAQIEGPEFIADLFEMVGISSVAAVVEAMARADDGS